MSSKPDETTREAILAYIIQYKRIHDGRSPTMREIGEAVYIGVSVVEYHLKRMADDGRIIMGEPGQARSIRVPGGEWVYRGQP